MSILPEFNCITTKWLKLDMISWWIYILSQKWHDSLFFLIRSQTWHGAWMWVESGLGLVKDCQLGKVHSIFTMQDWLVWIYLLYMLRGLRVQREVHCMPLITLSDIVHINYPRHLISWVKICCSQWCQIPNLQLASCHGQCNLKLHCLSCQLTRATGMMACVRLRAWDTRASDSNSDSEYLIGWSHTESVIIHECMICSHRLPECNDFCRHCLRTCVRRQCSSHVSYNHCDKMVLYCQ